MNRLVFLDESGAKTNMTRLRGRAARGQRVYDSAPHGHWGSTTMISSLRCDGATACMVVEGATDENVFVAYVRHVLLPTLQPEDCVILDNLAPHKNSSVSILIESVGATVRWLPPYSPDLNPIEKMWSKVKTFLRSAKARTALALEGAIAQALESITPSDAAHWFAVSGYIIN